MSEMPHCLSHVHGRKMLAASLCHPRIKEINPFLRILAPYVSESIPHIWGLKHIRSFGPETELKMLEKVVDCTIEVGKCIQ
jgi:hypothetical protein